ncbi:hypothetical protein BAUCODRAFT_32701 [Baudoinia panamericana UAMH 10762]|uniref:CRIB domain-containing protein n=1 Tax=Baudoinia panamericana (strain UAMH 10762) TaxID=717646 RepID=M2LR93_BAUPA|nr:uncharacterized protein BAUCODRAFT_32701 [Baudoinia panamericana UAMH 10762]EMC96957.1 hypothetical protein BAUCODRAFT_32701 [Baudoinia panamericana UAMH 10762]
MANNGGSTLAYHGRLVSQPGNGISSLHAEESLEHPTPLRSQINTTSHATHDRRVLRKRNSFFGRSNSDAVVLRRPPINSPTTICEDPVDVPVRPDTSLSNRRRRGEPLEQIRNSIFGGRRREAPPNSRNGGWSSNTSRGLSRDRDMRTEDVALPRSHFDSEEDYYRYLRKTSISPPFNFEHVTHTARRELPSLHEIDDRDLTARFWAIAAYQPPRRQLNGIEAEDLAKKLPAMGVERGASSSRPTSPVPAHTREDRLMPSILSRVNPGINEAVFGEATETSSDAKQASPPFRPKTPTGQPLRHPRRQSSLGALNEQRLQYLRQSPPSPARSIFTVPRSPQAPDPVIEEPIRSSRPVSKEAECGKARRRSSVIDRSKQPLPPLPSKPVIWQGSLASLKHSRPGTVSVASAASSEITESSRSKRSSRWSSASVKKSPAVSNTTVASDARLLSMVSDGTWEDDVDFCYQQEAESTCDFDWHGVTAARDSLADSDGGVRISAWIAPSSCSTTCENDSLRPRLSEDSPGRQHARASQTQHQRGQPVGHRGFLAARTGTNINPGQHFAPSVLELPSKIARVSILSPVFSVAASDESTPNSPFSPNTLHCRDSDGVKRPSSEYLSDPESSGTAESRRRASSSYSSNEAIARGKHSVGRETVRWSVPSSNSIPELLHSRRRSKVGIQKSFISRPLESLPQSPGIHDGLTEEESAVVPRVSQVEPMHHTFAVRQSQPSSNHVAYSRQAANSGTRPVPVTAVQDWL